MIEDTEMYKKNYWKQLEKEDQVYSLEPCLRDYGIYNVDVITQPKREQNNLTFYVQDILHNIPYKVSHDLKSRKTICSLLPNVV